MTLADVAVDLYGLPPGRFVAARTAVVRELRARGDRELAGQVQALRRPTAAAWATNLLVRHRAQDVEGLLALGRRLLEAQAAGAGDLLRDLDRQRHAAMTALRAEAHGLAAAAGQPLADAAAVPLEGILRAAMTDPAAAAAVRSGLLVVDLVSTGFGPVEVEGAVAVPGAPALTGVAESPAPVPDDDAPSVPIPRRAPTRRAATGRAATRRGGAERSGTAGQVPTPGATEAASAAREREAAAQEAAAQEAAAQEAAAQEAAARSAARRREERERAQADLDAALAGLDAAERERGAARSAAEDVARRRAELAARAERLAAELAQVEAGRRAVAVEERHARSAESAAEQAAATAARRARAARDRLDALDPPPAPPPGG